MPFRAAYAKLRENLPKINPVVAEGIAYHQMRDVEHYVDRLLQIAFRRDGIWSGEDLPDGFRYVGFSRLTPVEEYNVRAKKVNKNTRNPNKPRVDISLTDWYMIKCTFVNDGETIEKYLSIPFTRIGGLMHISGVLYGISAVLKTKGLSMTPKGYFAEFSRSKVQFEKEEEIFITVQADGTFWNEHVYMPYTKTLHSKTKGVKAYLPPVALWLFAKHGLYETFERYLNTTIQCFDEHDPALREIDLNEYAICKSMPVARGIKPTIAVVIPRKDLTPIAKILIGTIMYTARANYSRVIPQYVDNPDLWKIMLGFAIFGKGGSETRIIEEINTHFPNIERMMDVKFREELYTQDVNCETIYDFLFHVIAEMANRSKQDVTNMASTWGRYLTTTDYVMRDIRESIFLAHYTLIRLARKSNGEPLPTVTVDQVLNKHLKPGLISKITTGHGELTPFMSASDNMLVGLTCHCIDQTDAKKLRGGKKKIIDPTDPTNHIHASMLESGSVFNVRRSNPIGWGRINPYVMLDPQGKILRNPNLIEITDSVQTDLSFKGH